MLTRRELLERTAKVGAAAALLPGACARPGSRELWVNDLHSQLNRTRVHRIERPDSVEVKATYCPPGDIAAPPSSPSVSIRIVGSASLAASTGT